MGLCLVARQISSIDPFLRSQIFYSLSHFAVLWLLGSLPVAIPECREICKLQGLQTQVYI